MSKLLWHAETGESRVYGDDHETPEGWLPHHPHDHVKVAEQAEARDNGDKSKPGPADKPLTRVEVCQALEDGGLAYDPKATVAALTDQLVASLKDFLGKNEIEFSEDETPRALLAKVGAVEPK